MSSMIVVAHPDPDSFCSSLATAVLEGSLKRFADSKLFDLYADGFNPVMDLRELQSRSSFDPLVVDYQTRLANALRLYLVFPDWWGAMPAMLKGWIDRVFRPGIAWAHNEDEKKAGVVRQALMEGLEIALIVASDRAQQPSTITSMWLESICPWIGARFGGVLWCGPVRGSSWKKRQSWLVQAQDWGYALPRIEYRGAS